jgi:hypothetical protein
MQLVVYFKLGLHVWSVQLVVYPRFKLHALSLDKFHFLPHIPLIQILVLIF